MDESLWISVDGFEEPGHDLRWRATRITSRGCAYWNQQYHILLLKCRCTEVYWPDYSLGVRLTWCFCFQLPLEQLKEKLCQEKEKLKQLSSDLAQEGRFALLFFSVLCLFCCFFFIVFFCVVLYLKKTANPAEFFETLPHPLPLPPRMCPQ